MFLKRAFALTRNYLTTLRHLSNRLATKHKILQFGKNFLKASPIMLFVASTLATCIEDTSEIDPEILEITKQQLVKFLHQDQAHEFIVIIYDKFKRLNEIEFGKQLKPIIEQCKTAKIGKVYLIDSKEKEHLNQIVRLLKNIPEKIEEQDDEEENKTVKKKEFQCYYKCKFFNEAIQLERMNELPISKQINELRHFQFVPNNEKINEILTNHMSNPFNINKSYIVKQCLNEGQCVESYKRQIKKLIDGGMLNGKHHQFSFELVIDQTTGILGSSSEYVKNFVKSAQKLKEKSFTPNRKEQTYVFRNDIFGKDVSLYSQWLDKQGLNYSTSSDRFLMFIRPRINIITINNTLTDLMWYLRVAKLNNQVSISLNNIPRFRAFNNKETLEVLKILHEHFPNLNYLIVNSEKISELVRHVNADYKYVVFKQQSNVIWNKQFLDLDKLENLPTKAEKQSLFNTQFKQKIDSFIDNPQIKSFVQVEKQLQINLQKLRMLRDRQRDKGQLKKYIIRVCKDHCYRYLDQKTIDQINSKLPQPANIYWIDSTAQNIGVKDGNYLLKDGNLVTVDQFLSSS